MTALLLWLALSADPRAQLEALKARKAAEEAAARRLREEEASILDTLATADRALAEAEAAARRADGERTASERRLRRAEPDPQGSNPLERLLEVRDQIVPVFDPHRIAHEGVFDSDL